jgi:hypothetical protein
MSIFNRMARHFKRMWLRLGPEIDGAEGRAQGAHEIRKVLGLKTIGNLRPAR